MDLANGLALAGVLIAVATCLVALPSAIESLSRLVENWRKRRSRE